MTREELVLLALPLAERAGFILDVEPAEEFGGWEFRFENKEPVYWGCIILTPKRTEEEALAEVEALIAAMKDAIRTQPRSN